MINNKTEFYDKVKYALKNINRSKINALDDSEIKRLLSICHQLYIFNDINSVDQNVKNLNSIFLYGALAFNKSLNLLNLSGNKEKIRYLMESTLKNNDGGSWLHFFSLTIICLNENPQYLFLECLNNHEFINSFLLAFIILKKGPWTVPQYNIGDYKMVITTLKTLLVDLLQHKNCQSIIFNKAVTVVKLFKEINSFEKFSNDFTELWLEHALKIIDKVFTYTEGPELLKIMRDCGIVRDCIESIKNASSCDHNKLLLIIRLISLIFQYSEHVNFQSKMSFIYPDFETAKGYEVFANLLLKNQLNFDFTQIIEIRRKIIYVLVSHSFHGDAYGQGYSIISNEKFETIVRNLKSVNLLLLFYMENQLEEFDNFIVEAFTNYLHLNEKNFKILSNNNVFNALITNSASKSVSTHSLICTLVSFIFANYSALKLTEMNSINEILRGRDINYIKKIINVFESYIDSFHFNVQLKTSNSIPFISNLYCQSYKSDNEDLFKSLCKILIGIVRKCGSQEIIFNKDSPLMAVWSDSIDDSKFLSPNLELISQILVDKNIHCLEFLCEKLYRFSDQNVSSRLTIISVLNQTYMNNIKVIASFLACDGFMLTLNQIIKQQNILFINTTNSTLNDDSIICKMKIIKNACGIMLTTMNYDDAIELSSIFFYDADKHNFVISTFRLLYSFVEISLDESVQAQQCYYMFLIFEFLFKISFNDQSLYVEHIDLHGSINFEFQKNDVKYPVFIALIIDLCQIVFELSLKMEGDNCIEKFISNIFCFILHICEDKRNAQKLSDDWCIGMIVPILYKIWTNNNKSSLSDTIFQIFVRLINNNCSKHVFAHVFKNNRASVPYFIFSHFLRYKYKSILWWDMKEKNSFGSDVFQYFMAPTKSLTLDAEAHSKISESVVTLGEAVNDELNTLFQEDMKDLIGMLDKSSKSLIEANSLIQLDTESNDEINLSYLDSLSANSDQWKSLKSILISPSNINNVDILKKNHTVENPCTVYGAEQPIETNPSSISKDHCLNNFLKFILEVEAYNTNNIDSKTKFVNSSSYLEFNVVSKQNCFIHIPQTVKSSSFKSVKYGFDKSIFKRVSKQQFSYSVWLQIDNINYDKHEDFPIYLLSLTHNENITPAQICSDVDINFLTIAYYPNWQILVISSEPKPLLSIDLLSRTTNKNYQVVLNLDIKEKIWYNIICTFGAPKMITGKNPISIFINGDKFQTVSIYFEHLTHPVKYLNTRIGSLYNNEYFSKRCYRLGCIVIGKEIFSDNLIKSIFFNGPDGRCIHHTNNSSDSIDELRMALIDYNSSISNKDIILHLKPSVCNFSLIKNFYLTTFLKLSTIYDFTTSTTHENLCLVKNANFLPSFHFNIKKKLNPFFAIHSSSFESFTIFKDTDINRSLYNIGGIDIFLLFIEQSRDSRDLFNSLDRFFNFLSKNYLHLSTYISMSIIDILASLLSAKRPILDLQILLLIMSICSNKSYLQEPILLKIIQLLVLDIELWFNNENTMDHELLKFISNILLDNSLSPIVVNSVMLENYLIKPFLVCLLKYPMSCDCVEIYKTIIQKIFTNFNNKKIYKKLMLFIVNASIKNPSFEKWSNNSEIVSNNCCEISVFILSIIAQNFRLKDKTQNILFESVAGIHIITLILGKNVNERISFFAFKIFVCSIIEHIKSNVYDLNALNQSAMVSDYNYLSGVYLKISKREFYVNMDSFYYYISKALAQSSLSIEICTNFLFSSLTDGNITDVDKFDMKSSLENLIKYPMDSVRRFSTSTFYMRHTGSESYPIFYFNSKIVITIINFCTRRLDFFCKYHNEETSQSDVENLCLCLTYFLQMIYFSLVSRTELVTVCCSLQFTHGMLHLLRILHDYSFLKEKKDFCYSLSDFSFKVLVLILESTFTDPLSSGISAHWHNPVIIVDYPQLLLFSLINEKNNNKLSLNIISSILTKFFENISSDASIFTNVLKSNSKHVASISSFVRGQCLCFGSDFDKDIFIHFVNFTKSIFELNIDENLNSNIMSYSHSLNQYLSNILVIRNSNIREFLNKFKVLIPLMSANSHILFGKSNTHTDSLKNVMSFVFIHCYIVSNALCEENTDYHANKLDDKEIKTLKETFSRLKSIWDVFLINHLNVFKEQVIEIFIDCLKIYPKQLSYELQTKLSNPELVFYEIRKLNQNYDNFQEYINLMSKKCDFCVLNDEDSYKNVVSFWENYHNDIKTWYTSLLESQKFHFQAFLSSYYNIKTINNLYSSQKLREIHESLFHQGNIIGGNDNQCLQRFESLTTSGYFGIFQRLRKNDDFYYNYIIKFKHITRKELSPKSLFIEDFKENILKYLPTFQNVSIKDVDPFLSFLNRPININGVSLLKRHLKNQNILNIFRTVRISRLDAIEGLVLLTEKGIMIIDGLALTSQNIIVESANCPDGDTCVKNIQTQRCNFNDKSFYKYISYNNVLSIRKKRYSLMSIALEVFDYDNFSCFIVLSKPDRNTFIQRITQYLSHHKKFSISKHEMNILYSHFEPVISLLLDLKIQKVQQKWINREIDNFTYLLYLNILSGRSYNDLSQYPIFPWIISNYESQNFDLSDEKSYRCLSKPMGAQTQERLDGFLSRYKEWDNVGERLPKFLYATFYSTSMTTCSLLVRMEPFSSNLIELQGGNFDLPDRMFHCLKDSWYSAAVSNTADVKELLPEFYYLPEFLTNENKFFFGKKQSGIIVDDAVLPPWAKNDPREFIRINRAALESEYVSNNINNWIDLIFGFKQTGKKAIKSHNVFHSWFYKGSVNLDNVSDETIKRSIISFINNFGQVPKKIFSGPHPKRKSAVNMIHINSIFLCKKPIVTIHTESYNFPLKHIYVSIGTQFNVAFQKQILIPPYFKNKLSWERFDMSVCVIYQTNSQPIISNLFDTEFHNEISSSCFLDVKYLAFGCVDGNVSIWRYINTPNFHVKFHKFLHGHQTKIECIVSSSHQKLMITGSMDGCVYLWDIIDFTFLRKLSTNQSPIISLSIIESTSDIVVFQTNSISIFSVQGLKMASKNLLHKINCGISICNDLQDKFQYIAISTFKGIEIWKFGPEEISSESLDDVCQELDNRWVLCNDAFIKTSKTENQPLIRIISRFKVISIFESDNDDEVSCLSIDHKNKSLYAGTSKGYIYIVNRGILPST